MAATVVPNRELRRRLRKPRIIDETAVRFSEKRGLVRLRKSARSQRVDK